MEKETIGSICILVIGSSIIENGIVLAKLIKEKYDALQIKDKKLLFLTEGKYPADLSDYLDKNSTNIKTIMIHKMVTCQLSAHLLNLSKEIQNELNRVVFLLPVQLPKVDIIGSGSGLKVHIEAIREYDNDK
ncbi:hypothetical protein K502DRAFT_347967 [Neoconidiobolus thromboides FSU 785]|nr:hypothetical protein K502DRAFT_347967 [Neoconidiobolus thromboides FSU 785]